MLQRSRKGFMLKLIYAHFSNKIAGVKAVYKSGISGVQKIISSILTKYMFTNTPFIHQQSTCLPTTKASLLPAKSLGLSSVNENLYTLFTGLINTSTNLKLNNLLKRSI